MKIGVLSDTHDHLVNIKQAVDIFKREGIEFLIHAGDFCSPFVFKELDKLRPECGKAYAVFGNNDGDKVLLTRNAGGFCSIQPGILKINIDNRAIVVMHYPDIADELYRSGEFDLVIYGHTHKRRLDTFTKGSRTITILNPGSCAGYLADKPTIAVVELKSMSVNLFTLEQAIL